MALASPATKIGYLPDELMAEAAQRELAKRQLIPYAQYVAPWFQALPHHTLIADALERVFLYILSGGQPEVEVEIDEGRTITVKTISRLMVFMPPRHGKTLLVSQIAPSWGIGKMPDMRIITTGYGADLAQKNSSEIRNYVISQEFKNIFWDQSPDMPNIELAEDSQAKSNWDLARPYRGGVVATGIGGGITGQGAHLLIIDDPFKGRKDAESENYREGVMEWYQSSAHNRLEKGGAIVITHTRWHPEDLAGELVKAMVSDPLADQWEIIFLPAVALDEEEYPKTEQDQKDLMLRGVYVPMADPLGREPGTILWPEKYDKKYLEKEKAIAGDFEFTALYQQMPNPKDSGFFVETDFKVIEKNEVPEGLKWVRYIDLAIGKTKESDWNACVATALDPKSGDIIYRDMIHIQDITKFLATITNTMLLPSERGTIWGVEATAFQSLVVKDFLKDPRLANIPIKPITPIGSKEDRAKNVQKKSREASVEAENSALAEKDTMELEAKEDRALSIQTRGRQGNVKLVRGAWNQAFIREATAFPKGKHDDQVDSASGGLQMIAKHTRQHKVATQHEGYGHD